MISVERTTLRIRVHVPQFNDLKHTAAYTYPSISLECNADDRLGPEWVFRTGVAVSATKGDDEVVRPFETILRD